jgi:hypothetical protein
MCVASIPFPTALLADYLSGTGEHRTSAVAVYSGTLAVTVIFFTILWLYAAGNYRPMNRAVNPLLLRAMTRRYVFGILQRGGEPGAHRHPVPDLRTTRAEWTRKLASHPAAAYQGLNRKVLRPSTISFSPGRRRRG